MTTSKRGLLGFEQLWPSYSRKLEKLETEHELPHVAQLSRRRFGADGQVLLQALKFRITTEQNLRTKPEIQVPMIHHPTGGTTRKVCFQQSDNWHVWLWLLLVSRGLFLPQYNNGLLPRLQQTTPPAGSAKSRHPSTPVQPQAALESSRPARQGGYGITRSSCAAKAEPCRVPTRQPRPAGRHTHLQRDNYK